MRIAYLSSDQTIKLFFPRVRICHPYVISIREVIRTSNNRYTCSDRRMYGWQGRKIESDWQIHSFISKGTGCICHFVKWQIHPFISKGHMWTHVWHRNSSLRESTNMAPLWRMINLLFWERISASSLPARPSFHVNKALLCSAKPKGSICSLVEWEDTAFLTLHDTTRTSVCPGFMNYYEYIHRCLITSHLPWQLTLCALILFCTNSYKTTRYCLFDPGSKVGQNNNEPLTVSSVLQLCVTCQVMVLFLLLFCYIEVCY